MLALIRKDFIALRFFLAIGLAIYMLYAATSYQSPVGFFFLNIAASILLAVSPLLVEEKYQTDTLVCFLPPSRCEVVLTRYVMVLFALLAGLGLHLGIGALLSIHFDEPGFWVLCGFRALLLFCLIPSLIISLFMPCYFRFGLARGFFAFVVLLILLAIILASPLVTLELFSTGNGFKITPEMAQQPATALVAFMDHVASGIGETLFYSLVSLGGAAIVTTSVLLSIRFFVRRDF